MYLLSLISAAAGILLLWTIFSGRLYREPRLVVLTGFCTAVIGAFAATVLSESKLFPDANLAAEIMGFTVAATGGGIMANGLQMRSARMAGQDLEHAHKKLEGAERQADELLALLNGLKDKTPQMSDAEFNKTLHAMRRQAGKCTSQYRQARLKVQAARKNGVA